MNNRFFLWLLVLAGIVFIGWVYFFKVRSGTSVLVGRQTVQATPTPSRSHLGTPGPITGTTGNELEKGGVAARTVVTFTDKGFAPSPVTVKVGSTVTFVNESSGAMWVASDPHPTHTLLPGFDELTSVAHAGTYEYTFVKVGTWTYHNHVNPSMKGTVVVTK